MLTFFPFSIDLSAARGVMIVVMPALAISACSQPMPQGNEAQKASAPAAATKAAHHDGAHLQHHSPATDANPSSTNMGEKPPHIMAYMTIMDAMHQGMSAGVQAKNADVAFAQGMIAHHQGAIDMAKIELQYGKDAQMRALATQIMAAQQGEIAYMQNWLKQDNSLGHHPDSLQTALQAYEHSNLKYHNAMMQGMMATNPDVAFAKGMIPHHQGAITMAEVEKKYGKNKEMRQLATQIKQAQAPEIVQMQNWLAAQK